jgi:hypothetical protein
VSLKVDLKQDLFHIAYDPERVGPEQMLEAVRSKGFRGKVVPGGSSAFSAERKVRWDLARLPEELRWAVDQAKKANKPVLVAFHGPG